MSNINISEIKWGEPPVSTAPGKTGSRPASMVRDFCDLLRLRPGQWAKYPKLTRGGLSTAFLRREMNITDIEFTTRTEVQADGSKLTATYGRCTTPAAEISEADVRQVLANAWDETPYPQTVGANGAGR